MNRLLWVGEQGGRPGYDLPMDALRPPHPRATYQDLLAVPEHLTAVLIDGEIYVMASDGANVRRLTHTPGKGNWTPRWSPDGKKIIFCSNRGVESEGSEDAYEIYVMDADGSNVRQLTTNERSATRPHWSPDGKKVVYHSARDGNPKDWKDHEIYVMDADGSNVRRLTFNKAIDGHPAW